MTNKQRSYFSVLTLLLILLLFQSCSKDSLGVLDTQSTDGKITFDVLKKQIGNPELSKSITINTNKNSNKKLSFVIDTNSVKRLTRKNIVYSMVVTPNFIEDTIRNYNLLIYEKNNKFEQLLIKFIPTNSWEQNHKMGIKQPFDGKMIALSNYSFDQSTSKSTTQGEFAICYQTTTVLLCICEGHKSDNPICRCGSGFVSSFETTITSCESSAGGGGSENSDGLTFNPDLPVFDDPNYINKLKANYFWEAIGDAKRIWVNSNFTTQEIYKRLIDHQIEQKWSILSRENSIWAIDIFQVNQNITWDQFENWFMGTPEGLDGEYDAAFWENPNLTFPQQNLPKFSDFKMNYPSHTDVLYITPSQMFNSVGGMPLSIYNANPILNGNTCALRVSKALNYSNVIIPNIPGKTFKGKDDKYYFLGAANLMAWMKKTFGIPTGSNYLTGSQGGVNGINFANLLKDKEGIYVLIPNNPGKSGFSASGHADLFFANSCDGGCYFAAKGGVKEILFWELK